MSEIKVQKAGTLKEGNYILLNNIPCIITSLEMSKTSGRGVERARIEGQSIIDGRKIVELFSSQDNAQVPIVEKKNAQVLSINENKANVMDSETFETFDLDIPEELKNNIHEGDTVLYWIVMDHKVLRQMK